MITVCRWRAVSPELMTVVCRLKCSSVVVIIVGHAPHELTPSQRKDAFWSSIWAVTDDLARELPQAMWLFALDANARVGSVRSIFRR